MTNYTAFYTDVLIERYDFSNLNQLSDDNIKLLWCEVLTGMKSLNIDIFENLKKLNMKAINHSKVTSLRSIMTQRFEQDNNDESIFTSTLNDKFKQEEEQGIPYESSQGALFPPTDV